jgi:hypothetical protein
MKYMLSIQHGDMPGSAEWEALSEDEQKAVGPITRPSARPRG